ncbi:aldolase [Aliidongia dinghuensis]|uniref:Aldolase n=1 Tax=Aliidongia dinghuensis TaxID=1867774 RepID=A0A8J2YZ22_9PROT|nr:DUF1476 domain-containing protein [Aliidongia dinghuensis]GGF43469.1 aldolase [Aliidongia dinghuensis]
MTMFEDRERAAEKEFVQQRELPFKIIARRNRLLGLWAAGQLGLTGEAAAAYAAGLVDAEVTAPGDDAIIQKVSSDLKALGDPAVAEVATRLRQYAAEATKELGGETAS